MTGNAALNRNRGARLRRLLPRFGLVVVSIFIGLVVAEIGLRISGFQYFNPYIADRDVGYSLRPGAEGWWTREGSTYIKINSQGFRDREHPITKPSDTIRIAILGDSYAEAFQVPLEQTFWSIIEQKIAQCPQAAKSRVEVLNFGVSGFSTTRELILLQKRVWQYSPDIVVVLFTVGNDVRDNSRRLNEYRSWALPYFVLRDGKLTLDNSLVDARNQSLTFRLRQSLLGTAFNWAQNHLRLLGVIYTARERFQSFSETARENTAAQAGTPDEPGLDSEVYREPNSAEWDEAWRITELAILKMRDEVVMKNAKFLLVTGSMGIQVNPDPASRRAYKDRLGVNDLYYPERRLKRLGDNEGFKVLNLAPLLEEYAIRNQVFLHGAGNSIGRGHWNETGHRLAGELIVQELCNSVLRN